ncbi:MAG TPA: family 1 encapsulin nanocompartment shell protein [Acidimicrobiales bacterium]|nr:family 1 encapsulin nanocompartment shell protein [Acidimicrobiales bacterium]
MDRLLRELAPVSDDGWAAVEAEAKSRITTFLAARKLVDFEGPHGWEHAANNLGRVEAVPGPVDEVQARLRRVMPLVELRVPFTVSRPELENVDRGASDTDFGTLDVATARLGLAENTLVFRGHPGAGIQGILDSSSHPPLQLADEFKRYPTFVAKAVDVLRESGIGGPYGLAIAPTGYTGIIETTEHGGYPLLDHLHQILDGPVVWTPGIDGAAVLSLRGGDFVMDVGGDISIGYLNHDADSVTLYLEESLTFRVLEPDAVVVVSP